MRDLVNWRLPPWAFAGVVVTLLLGCMPSPAPECPQGYEHGFEYQLFFGLADRHGNTVSDAEWQAFMEDTVIEYFPAGSSVVEVAGHWSDRSGLPQDERTMKVHGLMGPTGGDGWERVEAIAEEYERRFNQDPVFRIVNEVCYGITP